MANRFGYMNKSQKCLLRRAEIANIEMKVEMLKKIFYHFYGIFSIFKSRISHSQTPQKSGFGIFFECFIKTI